jgi:5-formyltetrahydrofolate cyclo-ligase
VGDTDKAQLRASLGAARRARSAQELSDARAAICRHVLHRQSRDQWRSVAAYEPLRTEPGSPQLLAALHERAVRVLVPITQSDRDLDWTLWTPQRDAAPLAIGDPGDLGPAAIGSADAVLVPALAVANDGTRLGRGGGSYDRALARRGPHSVLAALVFADEIVATLPSDPWDVAVDAAVSPDGWHALGGNTTGADGS